MEDLVSILKIVVPGFLGGLVAALLNYVAVKRRLETEAETRSATVRKIEAESEKLQAETEAIRGNVRGIETEQVKVVGDIETIKFMFASMFPRWELRMLRQIAAPERFEVDTNTLGDSFRKDLADLWGRGLVKQRRANEFLPKHQGVQDVKDYYEIDELGRQYLKLRKQYLDPGEPAQEQTEGKD